MYCVFAKDKSFESLFLPVSANNFGLFVTDLYSKGLKYNTIKGHVSTISYIHKLGNYPVPSQTFYISKLLTGIRKHLPSFDARLPIDKKSLLLIFINVDHVVHSDYAILMYRAIFLLAYHVCLRVDELVLSQNKENVLQLVVLCHKILQNYSTSD